MDNNIGEMEKKYQCLLLNGNFLDFPSSGNTRLVW